MRLSPELATSCAHVEQRTVGESVGGQSRFLERVMALDEFRRIYRTHLEDFLGRLYAPDRLHRRMDEIAA